MLRSVTRVELELGVGGINDAKPVCQLSCQLSIQNIWASIQNIWGAPPLEYFTILLSHNDTNKYYGITPQAQVNRSTLASTPAKESQLKVVLQDAIPNGRQNPLDLAEDTLDGGARCLH